jgi:DNA-binding FadR family transcriptional regulator
VTFEFHERVCELAGDRTLSMIARALMHVFDSRVQDNVYPAREQGRVLGEHQAIAAAIRAGDADLARTLMRSHLESYRKSLRRRFSALIQRVIDWG